MGQDLRRASTLAALAITVASTVGCGRGSAPPGGARPVIAPSHQSAAPRAPQLAGAAALYDRGDQVNATLLLGPLITAASTRAERQRAEYDLAKSLYRMGLRAAAMSRLDEIARQGSAHAYHRAAVPWIAAI